MNQFRQKKKKFGCFMNTRFKIYMQNESHINLDQEQNETKTTEKKAR